MRNRRTARPGQQRSGKLCRRASNWHARQSLVFLTVHCPHASRIQVGSWTDLASFCRAVRTSVFLAEQGIDPAEEWDEHDTPALHAVAFIGARPVGTARLIAHGADTARVGRMAVLAAHRTAGIGRRLLMRLLVAARARGDRQVVLHAQVTARGFYERAGFVAQGPVFDEAGISHVTMHRRLDSLPEDEPMTETTNFSICDLCDVHKADTSGAFRVLPPVFRDFGARGRFAGRVVTLQCFEDNSLVKQWLDQPGEGRVLVVDGGGSLRKALVGGNIGAAAARNGWAGVVIDGCVRDVGELAACDVGIRALAAMPLPTEKKQQGLAELPVRIQGVWVRPGDWLYADADGIVVMSPEA